MKQFSCFENTVFLLKSACLTNQEASGASLSLLGTTFGGTFLTTAYQTHLPLSFCLWLCVLGSLLLVLMFDRCVAALCRSSSPDVSASLPSGLLGTRLEHYETNYMEYLEYARAKVQTCMEACSCWCYPYDGDSPPPDFLLQSPGESSSASESVQSTPVVTPAIEIKPFPPGDVTPTAEPSIVSPLTAAAGATDSTSGKQQQRVSDDKKEAKEATNTDFEEDSGKGEEDNVEALPVIRDASASSSSGGAKIRHEKQDSSADSVISEADSALSGSSSCNTEAGAAGLEAGEPGEEPPPGSRSDSPLNDDFDAHEFNAFLLSLKRVKTPVEFCDNMEDSIQEFEELLNSLKLNIGRTVVDAKVRGDASVSNTSEELPKFVSTPDSQKLVRPSAAENTNSDARKARPTSGLELTEFDKEINKPVSASETVPIPVAPSSSQPKPTLNTPIKYSAGAPNIGKSLAHQCQQRDKHKIETCVRCTDF